MLSKVMKCNHFAALHGNHCPGDHVKWQLRRALREARALALEPHLDNTTVPPTQASRLFTLNNPHHYESGDAASLPQLC